MREETKDFLFTRTTNRNRQNSKKIGQVSKFERIFYLDYESAKPQKILQQLTEILLVELELLVVAAQVEMDQPAHSAPVLDSDLGSQELDSKAVLEFECEFWHSPLLKHHKRLCV